MPLPKSILENMTLLGVSRITGNNYYKHNETGECYELVPTLVKLQRAEYTFEDISKSPDSKDQMIKS
jgi:hypothetical protein